MKVTLRLCLGARVLSAFHVYTGPIVIPSAPVSTYGNVRAFTTTSNAFVCERKPNEAAVLVSSPPHWVRGPVR